MFLDSHISEVNKHVVQLAGAGCVLNRAEPAEAKFVPEDQTKGIEVGTACMRDARLKLLKG